MCCCGFRRWRHLYPAACGRNSQTALGRGLRPVPALHTGSRDVSAAPADLRLHPIAKRLRSASVNAGGSFDARTRDRQDSTGAWAAPRASYLAPRAAARYLADAHAQTKSQTQPPPLPGAAHSRSRPLNNKQTAMSAAETEEEAPPPQKKSIFSCLTNLPGVCVPQKSAEGEEPARRLRPATRQR